MIARLGEALSKHAERWMPSPFVLALVLTLLTLLLAVFLGQNVADQEMSGRLATLAGGWFDGFYGTGGMKFALQMTIVLITGHALAKSGPVRTGIAAIARVAKTPKAAALIVALVACLASLVQWGLGAIVGAFMAREMGRAFAESGRTVHYPLLGAAGYAGFMVWHGGFSGSAPLKVADKGHFVADVIGVVSIDQTLLSPLNITIVATLLVVIPGLFWGLMPEEEEAMTLPDFDDDSTDDQRAAGSERRAAPLIYWLEETPLLNVVSGAAIFGYLAFYFFGRGVAGWNLDSINLLFLSAGIFLYPSPGAYVDAIVEGVKGAAGIILQFPFYFGILGILKASGLITQIAEFFINISSATTFPVFAFLSAGIVNFFVPSGGGQWAVQGQVLMEAANGLGVPVRKAIMAFSYGDAWTNMLQPFWALPLLGIMDLEARDIIGYTALVMFVTGPLIMVMLVLL